MKNNILKKLLWYIAYSGIWIVPAVVGIGMYIHSKLDPYHTMAPKDYFLLLMFGGALSLWIWSTNEMRIKNGKSKDKLQILPNFINPMPDPFDQITGKQQYMYPDINEELLFESPFDCFYCLGYVIRNGKKRYIGVPFDDASPKSKHLLISGGSGSGKSSAQIINFLLNLKMQKLRGAHNANALILDPKGELWNLTGINNPDAIKIDLTDRINGYGFNPFIDVTDNFTEQALYDLAYLVTISIIPKPGPKSHETGPWIPLAQDMLLGFILYGIRYKGFRSLPEIVRFMLSKPMEELIEEACSNCAINSNAYMHLIQFRGMSPETLYSVTSTCFPRVKPFATDQNLVYGMSVNQRMFRMEDLLNKSVYIVVPLDKIQQWGSIIFMLINMFSLWLFSLPEKASEPQRADIVLCLDETTAIFQALGSVPEQYPQLLRYGRSYGFTCLTAVQSLAGLKTILDDASVDDLLSNMPYKVFLDCTTEPKMLIDWIGKYKRRMITYNGIGKTRTTSVSFTDDDILSPSEAQMLGSTDELILISAKSGYSRFKKDPWYKSKEYISLL